MGTQTDEVVGPQVGFSGVQRDIVTTPSYADVTSQCVSGVDTVMGGVSGPSPVPPLGSGVRAQALVVHGVSCMSGLRAVKRCAHRLNNGVCTVCGVRWLLG